MSKSQGVKSGKRGGHPISPRKEITPAIFINSSTIKARCSADHAMVYTENGTYTAV
jgi:hypothetical protein